MVKYKLRPGYYLIAILAGRHRNIRRLLAAAYMAIWLVGLPKKLLADTLIPGDLYVYISPGVAADITDAFHEDPIIFLNGQYVLVTPDYSSGLVYDLNGHVIGFIALPA